LRRIEKLSSILSILYKIYLSKSRYNIRSSGTGEVL
jgi:hypothetical protein